MAIVKFACKFIKAKKYLLQDFAFCVRRIYFKFNDIFKKTKKYDFI